MVEKHPEVGIYKENKKVRKQENTLSTKKATRKIKDRKHALDQESDQEKSPFFFS